jgi:hypothetical protein
VKDEVRAHVKNVLAHVQVLAPSVPLEKLWEDIDDDNYLESIENAESEVEDQATSLLINLISISRFLMTKLIIRFFSI